MPTTYRSVARTAWKTSFIAGSLVLSSALGFARSESKVAVGVVHNVAWSPGDTQRDGACEFEIFLTVAQLQQSHRNVGLVGVGNHNGRLSTQAEQALDNVALRGIAVAKIAPAGGSVARTAEALFVDAGTLPEKAACELLQTCIERYGPLPAAANPSQPTVAELHAIRRQLQRYQEAFTTATSPTVASRG